MGGIRTALSMGVGLLALSAPAAMAQTADAGAAETSGGAEAGRLDDIVVTAQRKAERLQEVPISVNSVSGDRMTARGITDSFALATAVPGLSISRVATVSTPYLRGIGSNGANPNNEASVATYVDGIYYAAPFGNLFSFNNVARVEVLKGPQGTLFGRNATGGVIQIVTRDPSHDPAAEFNVGYGNYDTWSASGYATTGLSETLAMDVAVQYQNQRDGFGRNQFLNIDVQKGREFAVRSKMLWTPSDRTTVTLSGDYAYSRNSYNDYNRPKDIPSLDGVVRNLPRYDSFGDTAPISKTRQYGAALRIEQDLDFARLVSLTARRISKGLNQFDYDTSPLPLISPVQLYGRVKTWSQELQLLSPAGSTVDWTVGAFYFDNRPVYVPSRLCGVGVVQSGCLDIYGLQHTKSLSAYAQATVEVLPDTKLTGGLRFTHETQTFNGGVAARAADGTVGPYGAAPGQRNEFNKPTWRIALDHAFSRDLHVYASYNRGIKSGGFDLQSPGTIGYKPEILDAYEIGIKSELFDRRLRFNAAAFYYDFQDIQVTAIQNTVVRTFNAAGARMKGIDVDLELVVSPELRITGGGSYVDGKFTDFPNPGVYPASAFDPPISLDNAKGKRTTRTPKFTGNAGFDYTLQTDAGTFALSSNLYYNDGFYWEPDNRFRQKSYWLLNASLAWHTADERFGVRLWGQNLTNSHYLSQGVGSAVGDLRTFAAPRTYGVTLSTKF